MKRTCSGCRAELIHEISRGCELRFATEEVERIHGCTTKQKPLEECPKPLTVKEYIRVLEELKPYKSGKGTAARRSHEQSAE